MPFKPYEQDQGTLFPSHIGDLVPEDHLVRVVSEVVARLDCTAILNKYSEMGRNAYQPVLLLKLLFYGYAIGLRSSRGIAKAVREVVPFMWLAAEHNPDFRTISDFRKNHLIEIQDLFVQVVRLCRDLGMVRVGHWSIDGTKVKASAGRGNAVTRETLERELAHLHEEIGTSLAEAEKVDAAEDVAYGSTESGDNLPKELRRKGDRAKRIEEALKTLDEHKERKSANRTDPDAPMMKRKGGGFEPSYNPQITVDSDSQVIIASDVTDEGADNGQLIPQIDQAIQNVEMKPKEISADAGYTGATILKEVADRQIDAYIPQNENPEQAQSADPSTARFTRDDFKFDAETNCFTCPAGQKLEFSQIKIRECTTGSYEVRVYKRTGCEGCALASRCLKGKAKTRAIDVSPYQEVVRAAKERLTSPAGRVAYAKRKQTVEPVFGVMKAVLGFRQFLLRGLDKVRGEWCLASGAFNMRKIWAAVVL